MVSPLRIAIVGVGPRGLGLLERLVSRAGTSERSVIVELIEPGTLGVGMHVPSQPDYLLLNTVCSQLTAFTDQRMLGEVGAVVGGPSLYEWCRQRGSQFQRREVAPTDHLPRALLGEYLAWAAERIVDLAPANLTIRHHAETATTIEQTGATERVHLADGTVLEVDQVVVAVGHGDPAPQVVDATDTATPYPLPGSLSDVGAGESVALAGVGLTAMDVLAALTVGRGGRFDTADSGGLRYLPSGDEPRVVLLSRHGRPARARPLLTPGRVRIPAKHLTRGAIEALQAGGPADFVTDVLPLLLDEMGHRWQEYADTPAPDFRRLLLDAVPAAALGSQADYATWYAAELADDLEHAHRGLGADPLKEALEVLRDHRDALRAAVDFDGVTEDSRAWFYEEFVSVVNRMVIGPQLERHEELLALLTAGVVTVGPGPDAIVEPTEAGRIRIRSKELATPQAVVVDRVLTGYSAPVDLHRARNPLIAALALSGRVVEVADRPLGIRIDKEQRAIGVDGSSQDTLRVFGPLTEGSTYYNHYVATPDGHSRAVADADALARALLVAAVEDGATG